MTKNENISKNFIVLVFLILFLILGCFSYVRNVEKSAILSFAMILTLLIFKREIVRLLIKSPCIGSIFFMEIIIIILAGILADPNVVNNIEKWLTINFLLTCGIIFFHDILKNKT